MSQVLEGLGKVIEQLQKQAQTTPARTGHKGRTAHASQCQQGSPLGQPADGQPAEKGRAGTK